MNDMITARAPRLAGAGHSAGPRRTALALLAILATLTSACSSTGATFRSGVGDAFPEHPPYYAGSTAPGQSAEVASTIGYLPIVYARGASQPGIFDPRDGEGTPMGDLLAEMNGALDSLARGRGLGLRLAEGGKVSAVTHAATLVPPNVIFGCITETGAPDDDCAERGDSVLGRQGQRMRLAVGRPSSEWTAWQRELLTATGMRYTLVLTLEVGQYLPRQRGLLGAKEVELGTGHVVRLPWLTSLESPVSVLQLTGTLVNAEGRSVRIGAEGIQAHRSRLLVSAARGQELLSEQDVRDLRTARRDDLPDHPLAWQVALRNLVVQLTGATS